jgi:hypothetical protein
MEEFICYINTPSKEGEWETIPCNEVSPQSLLQETLTIAGILNFSFGKMKIPARVRSSWGGLGEDLLTRRASPILRLLKAFWY